MSPRGRGDEAGLPLDDEAIPEAGFVAAELADELRGLGLRYLTMDARTSRSPSHVRGRLRSLSDRFTGAQAINLRHQAIPWAYRVFFRHIGLDPDEQQTPVEELALERMFHGGFVSRNLLDDAITIGIVESGVALRAFDAAKVSGRLGVRPSVPGEGLARPLPAGTLVIADELRPLALLFGDPASAATPGKETRRAMIVAVQVRGVPDIAVEEAIWLAASVIRS